MKMVMRSLQAWTVVFVFSTRSFCSAFVVPHGTISSSARRILQPPSPLQLSKKENDGNVPNFLSFQRGFEGLFSPEGRKNGVLIKKIRSVDDKADFSFAEWPSVVLSSTLAPVAEFLDDTTDGWALSYADLRPESEQTTIGQSFLATNVAYAAVGLLLSSQGELLLGFMTEIVAVASFCYHYTQLQQPYNRTDDATVKLALLVDYTVAISSILIGLVYVVQSQTLPAPEVIASSTFGIACLLACWVWERGYPYIVLHSLWHIFSAATAYSIGSSHVS